MVPDSRLESIIVQHRAEGQCCQWFLALDDTGRIFCRELLAPHQSDHDQLLNEVVFKIIFRLKPTIQ